MDIQDPPLEMSQCFRADFFIYPARTTMSTEWSNKTLTIATFMKILSVVNETQDAKRKGVFTSGMVAVSDDHKIGLFFGRTGFLIFGRQGKKAGLFGADVHLADTQVRTYGRPNCYL